MRRLSAARATTSKSAAFRREHSAFLAGIVRLTPIALLFGLNANCTESVGPNDRVADTVKAEWVTGSAARALDASGRFVFDEVSDAGSVAESSARIIADAFVTSFARDPQNAFFRAQAVLLRGGPIDWLTLERCRSPIRVRSPYGPLVDSTSRPLVRYVADHWMYLYCEGSGEQSLVADISLGATNIIVDSTGVRFDSTETSRGNELSVYPQVASGRSAFMSPERAAAIAYAFSRKRIAKPPMAMQRGQVTGAVFVSAATRWLVTLEDSVEVILISSGERRRVAELFVGRDSTFREVVLLPSTSQAATVPMSYVEGDTAGGRIVPVRVPVKNPIDFHEIALVQP